jgi:CheY-like chemotaxis protein
VKTAPLPRTGLNLAPDEQSLLATSEILAALDSRDEKLVRILLNMIPTFSGLRRSFADFERYRFVKRRRSMNAEIRTVLVVEDEPLIRMTLADNLIDAGYKVVEAGNVLEAVGALSRYDEISAVVTDVDMPGMLNGLALVKLIRNGYSDIDIVVVSGRPDIADWLPDGANFFAKPYRASDIAAYLNEKLPDMEVATVSLAG